jgi:hypothetical protein
MKYDKNILKKRIDQSKPDEILVLTINSLDKDSLSNNIKLVEKFIRKSEDYLIIVIMK